MNGNKTVDRLNRVCYTNDNATEADVFLTHT